MRCIRRRCCNSRWGREPGMVAEAEERIGEPDKTPAVPVGIVLGAAALLGGAWLLMRRD